MLELFDVSFYKLKDTSSDDLYRLRKKTFSDRLQWDVACNRDMEFDEFDNPLTKYILGLYQGQLICSVRFNSLDQPNMITHTFRDCFYDINLPNFGIESSRFFVDKTRTQQFIGKKYPVSRALFLAMINWARHYEYSGIYTIVSRAMLTILKRTGWQIKVIKEAFLNEQEKIYLVYLPTRKKDQINMASGLTVPGLNLPTSMSTWPLMLPV